MTRPGTILFMALLIAAMVMAAGCVSPGTCDQIPSLPEEKYIFLEHKIDTNLVPVYGNCVHPDILLSIPSASTFDEKTSELDGIVYTDNPETDTNETLKLVYFIAGRRFFGQPDDMNDSGKVIGSPVGVFSFPGQFSSYSDDVVIDSARGDGSVVLRYHDEQIVLKPKERKVNITHQKYQCDQCFSIIGTPNPVTSGCTEEIITTDTLYNAGIFDKKIISSPKGLEP